MSNQVRLQVNVDHVATLRQARGTAYPDPVKAAEQAISAGCHGITVHLREDRRHIQDDDVHRLREKTGVFLNLEMAATEEMLDVALKVKPDLVTLVPERRQERTTEGGLDVGLESVRRVVEVLADRGQSLSLFIDPSPEGVDGSRALGVELVELHTGDYAHAAEGGGGAELERLAKAARTASSVGLRVAAGHGLTVQNTPALLARAPQIEELNIGHALVSDSVFVGIEGAVHAFQSAIERGIQQRS